MNENEYIKNLIEQTPEYSLTSDDKKCIQFEGVGEYIYKRLSSTKYRNTSIPNGLEKSARDSIKYCVKNKLPIHIMLPFGGYKRWNLPTHPGIDYAEVFNLILLREYLSPIAKGYEYGVILHYYSVELFVERNNHIPQANIDFYQKEFLQLLEVFKKFLPINMQLKFTNLREEISQKDALEAVEIKIQQLKKDWANIPQKDKDLKIKRAKVNCMVDIQNPKYEEIILDAVYVHDAFSSQCWDQNGKVVWITAPDMITIGHSYTSSWGIHIKSSHTSRVNFWVGLGAVLNKNRVLQPTILSYNQYLAQKDGIKYEDISFFGKDFMNLGSLPVISESK